MVLQRDCSSRSMHSSDGSVTVVVVVDVVVVVVVVVVVYSLNQTNCCL